MGSSIFETLAELSFCTNTKTATTEGHSPIASAVDEAATDKWSNRCFSVAEGSKTHAHSGLTSSPMLLCAKLRCCLSAHS